MKTFISQYLTAPIMITGFFFADISMAITYNNLDDLTISNTCQLPDKRWPKDSAERKGWCKCFHQLLVSYSEKHDLAGLCSSDFEFKELVNSYGITTACQYMTNDHERAGCVTALSSYLDCPTN